MGNRFQDVNLDFGRVAEIVGGKFEVNTQAELAALETVLAAVPALDQLALDGLSVTLAGENGVSSSGVYYYSANDLKFKTSRAKSQTAVFDMPNSELGLADLRVGEFFFYTGPAGTFAATYNTQPILAQGETELLGVDGNGGAREVVEVVGFLAGTPIVTITPLTRGDGGGFASFFTTLNLVVGSNTVTHNLGLVDKDAFVARVADSAGSEINVDVDSVDVNSITLSTLVPRTGVRVFISGSTV